MKLYRLTYVIDEQVNAVLQGINEVHITYEDLESPSDEATGVNSQLEVNPENITTEDNTAENTETTESTETMSTEENLTDVSEDVTTDTSATDLNENEVEPVLNGIDDSTIDVSANVVADSSIVMNSDTTDVNPTDAEFASDTEKGTVNEGQEQTTAQATGTASFTDSERAELEALKKEKKLTLISNYEDFLTEEDKDALINSIDDYNENALELVLLKKYKEYKDLEHNSFNKMAPLAAPEPHKPEAADKQLNSYIRRMLRR